jgi:hypothetical protein
MDDALEGEGAGNHEWCNLKSPFVGYPSRSITIPAF